MELVEKWVGVCAIDLLKITELNQALAANLIQLEEYNRSALVVLGSNRYDEVYEMVVAGQFAGFFHNPALDRSAAQSALNALLGQEPQQCI